MKLKKENSHVNYEKRNDEILTYIKAFCRRHLRMPTAIEIRDANRLKSTDTALYILKRLCKVGKLKHSRRGIYEIVKS